MSVPICHFFTGNTRRVSTYQELKAALEAARPSDTVVITQGIVFSATITVDTPVCIRGDVTTGGGAGPPYLRAAARFPLFLTTAPVSFRSLTITGWHPPTPDIPVNYFRCMCALDLRMAAELRDCSVQSHGTCVLINRMHHDARTQPGGVVITNCTLHDSTCAGVCVHGGQEPPSCFRVSGNRFLRNGWGYQDDGNSWGTLDNLFPGWTAHNTFEDNDMLYLPYK
jgi:hypothetical protein